MGIVYSEIIVVCLTCLEGGRDKINVILLAMSPRQAEDKLHVLLIVKFSIFSDQTARAKCVGF